ncbi:hypothetical protein BJ170DRAFT_211106 [Xylariales sp. AK1849]|nr:hypothetical protein BJ170DRAFT_211106 [Xylariales sp. AK1849]
MWERIIPQVAFDSEVVPHPMLALSALHLHSHSPSNSPMALAVTRYLDKALVDHRQALKKYDGELTEQVWLSAVILSNMFWVLSHQSRASETYELPKPAWNMISGISTLFCQKQTQLQRMGYAWFGHENLPLIVPNNELPPESQKQLEGLEDDLADLLDKFKVQALPDQERVAYSDAQEYVVHYYQAYFAGAEARNLRRFIGTMALRRSPTYRQLLEKHDPLVMALLARMTVLLRALDYAWWINGKGDYEVLKSDVRGICGLIPSHLRWCMDWPCRVLSGDVIISRLEDQ